MNADLNNANKTNRRRTVKTRSRFTTLLTVYFFVALIIPNCVLANTEPYSAWTVEALILRSLVGSEMCIRDRCWPIRSLTRRGPSRR